MIIQASYFSRNGYRIGIAATAALAVLAYAIATLAYTAYARLDSLGWIPHYAEVDINYETGIDDESAAEKWTVGKSKDCVCYPEDPVEAPRLNLSAELSAISPLDCRNDIVWDDVSPPPPLHAPVTFWGRTEQPEYEWIKWHCTRNLHSLTCKQTGNSAPIVRGTDRATGKRVKSYDGGKNWKWMDP